MAAQFIEERTLSHPGRGRSFIQEGEDAVQGGTQSSSGQGERCPVRRRTLSSLERRTLSISEGKGCRSEGLLSDPILKRVDLSSYLQIQSYILQIWRFSPRSSLGSCRSEEILADLVQI